MIQQTLNGMITLMLVRFMLNDLPHAAGVCTSTNTSEKTTSIKYQRKLDFFRRVYDDYYVPYVERSRDLESIKKDLVPWITLSDSQWLVQPPRTVPPKPRLWYHGCEVGSLPEIEKTGLKPPVYITPYPTIAAFFGFLKSWGTWSAVAVINPAYVPSIEEDEWYAEKAIELERDPADKAALRFFTRQQVNMFYGKLWKVQYALPVEGIKEVWIELREHAELNPNWP